MRRRQLLLDQFTKPVIQPMNNIEKAAKLIYRQFSKWENVWEVFTNKLDNPKK
jgi:hypothetical protein